MFDTITVVSHTCIHPSYLQQAESFTYLKEGELRTKYTLKDSLLSSIVYTDYNQTLTIQISIPKFLYGNNVILIKESDIPLFFQRLHERLNELFGICMNKEDWYTKRLDVCWNFPVENEIDDYLEQLRKIKIPRMKPETRGHSETVIHANGSKQESDYIFSQEKST